MRRKITKLEFEKSYCERRGISKAEYDEYSVTLKCDCEYEECEGWASVSNNELAIESHKRNYQI